MIFKTPHKTDSINGESGFTLIEVLIAITIFAIGIMAVGAMQIDAMSKTTTSRRATEAMALAEDQAEILRSLPFYDKNLNLDGVGGADPFDIRPELRTGDHPQDGDPLQPDSPYTVRWSVDPTRPLPGYPPGVVNVDAQPNSMTIRIWVTPDNDANDILAEIEFAKFCGEIM